MNDDCKLLADSLGLNPETLRSWRNGFSKGRTGQGRPRKGKKRPWGMLAVGDIVSRYSIKAHTLAQWRAEGMKHRVVGILILTSEKTIKEWIAKKIKRRRK
jgi:transposase-like protein